MTADRFREFLAKHPEYASTSRLDDVRAAEYSRLDEAGDAYLDYTGAGIYAASQIRRHADLLASSLLGNPHSASPASSDATRLVERSRRAVLDWFNAGDDYTAIFTLNATGALKHVAESYPFSPGDSLLLTVDNHNSVNGIREFAVSRGASVSYAPLTTPELRVDQAEVDRLLN
ncbi:MAG TPA: aminotransferase class V-fold PLP-dependent enzyme, partial [Vicinamibacterales bacterium]|nr:aminotransferase class V-fold PLP-dependent enzyme [Vicinamibacterales bacterium]